MSDVRCSLGLEMGLGAYDNGVYAGKLSSSMSTVIAEKLTVNTRHPTTWKNADRLNMGHSEEDEVADGNVKVSPTITYPKECTKAH
jgi:hypothetical protein